MTTNYSRHITTNELVSVRQLFFSHVTFSLSSEVRVAFNISSSHANNSLRNRRFSHKQFLLSKYSSILHALLHSQPHVLEFHI